MASSFRNELMYKKIDPTTKQMFWFGMKYHQTQYESPKTYRNNFAFNTKDDWLLFPTEYRTKSGKPKGITLTRKNAVVKELMYFGRFQKLIGVETKEELVYHMSCFLGDVVKIHKGVFDPTFENITLLYAVAERILNTECKDDTLKRLKDDRRFSIDPERLKSMDDSTKSIMRNKGKRFATFLKIREKYDETKSKAENAVLCGVSETTIARYRRNKDELERYYNTYFRIDDE